MLIQSQIDGRVVRLSNRKWNADMRNEIVLTLYLHEPFSGAMLAGVPPCKGRVFFDHRKVGNEHIQQSVA